MSFLTKDDFNRGIKGYILDQITSFDDDRVTEAISTAIEEMKAYLNSRYDVNAIFTATGNNRHPLIIMYCVDIALYRLHAIVDPSKTPQHRMDRYDLALEWLGKVQARKVNPELPVPTLPEAGLKDDVRFGGNTQRRNQF